MIKILGLSFLILCAAFSQVYAQTICASHKTVVEKLKEVFNEQPTGAGLSSNGGMLEVYASSGGTWTIVLTRPDGLSCLLATGKHWQDMKPDVEELEL